MNRSTTSLSFPDVNVWMAILLENHVHRPAGLTWWQASEGPIAFTRFTQISMLRLLTTSAAMDGKPLTMEDAWRAHDRLFEDDRVALHLELADVKRAFGNTLPGERPPPKFGATPGCWQWRVPPGGP